MTAPSWLPQAIFGAVVSVGITVGLVLYEKHEAAAAAGPLPPAGTTQTTATQTLSLTGQRTVTVTLPTGATFENSTTLDPTVASASQLIFTALKAGTTFGIVTWTDSGGSPQKTTVPITVTA